jgi:hypothetical protein
VIDTDAKLDERRRTESAHDHAATVARKTNIREIGRDEKYDESNNLRFDRLIPRSKILIRPILLMDHDIDIDDASLFTEFRSIVDAMDSRTIRGRKSTKSMLDIPRESVDLFGPKKSHFYTVDRSICDASGQSFFSRNMRDAFSHPDINERRHIAPKRSTRCARR